MNPATTVQREREIEDLARSVTCPICGRGPGERCWAPSMRGRGLPAPQPYAHHGRLLLARGAK